MGARIAGPDTIDPDATEFVRFCYRRRRVGWPELYDEMCAVAARGRFRGMGPDELAGLGIGFSLFDMPALAGLAATVIAEEQAKRRPVAVAIVAEPVGVPIETLDAVADPVAEPAAVAVVDVDPTPVAPEVDRSAERSPEPAGIDVPIRLAALPAAV